MLRAARVTALAGVLLLSLAAPSPPGSALREARIQITVRGDTAAVIAWYRFTGAEDSLAFDARRPAGETLAFQGVAGAAGFRLDTLPTRFRLMSHQRDSAAALDVRYRVIGEHDSVPLFVPHIDHTAARGGVLVRVSGDARPAPHAAPRFRAEPGAGWLARLDRVPAFVVLSGR